MKNLYILKCGSTFDSIKENVNDFEHWIIEKLENKNRDIKIIDAQKTDLLPLLTHEDALIITGSHSMVTNEELWSLEVEKWLPKLIDDKIPLLAICYGHQLLAKSLGGVSSYHEKGIEIGTVDISLDENAKDDILFSKLSQNFKAHTVHSQTVKILPSNAIRLAFNAHDENHAYKVGSCAWSVQFHPEFDEISMNGYIEEVAKHKDIDAERLKKEVQFTYEATSLIKEFERLFL